MTILPTCMERTWSPDQYNFEIRSPWNAKLCHRRAESSWDHRWNILLVLRHPAADLLVTRPQAFHKFAPQKFFSVVSCKIPVAFWIVLYIDNFFFFFFFRNSAPRATACSAYREIRYWRHPDVKMVNQRNTSRSFLYFATLILIVVSIKEFFCILCHQLCSKWNRQHFIEIDSSTAQTSKSYQDSPSDHSVNYFPYINPTQPILVMSFSSFRF